MKKSRIKFLIVSAFAVIVLIGVIVTIKKPDAKTADTYDTAEYSETIYIYEETEMGKEPVSSPSSEDYVPTEE